MLFILKNIENIKNTFKEEKVPKKHQSSITPISLLFFFIVMGKSSISPISLLVFFYCDA